MTDLPEKLLEILVCLIIATRGTCLPFSCEKPNALSRKKWRTRYCPSLHSRRPWFVLVYDPAGDNLVKLSIFSPKKSCQTFNFVSPKTLSNFQLFTFFLENLVKLLTLFSSKNLVKLSIFLSDNQSFNLFGKSCQYLTFFLRKSCKLSTFSSENLTKLSTFLFQLLLQWGVSPWCFKPLSNKTGRNEWWRRRPFTISKRTWVLSL